MQTTDQEPLAQRFADNLRLSAYGHSGSTNYITLTHETGAFQLSPYVGREMDLPKAQGDSIISGAANRLNLALQAAGLETRMAPVNDGLTSKGTAPVRIEFDESKPDVPAKLDRAVTLVKGLEAMSNKISTWHDSWRNAAMRGQRAAGSTDSYDLGMNRQGFSLQGDNINFTFEIHDGSYVATNAHGQFQNRAANDHSIPASLIGPLAKLTEKLGELGINLRSVAVSDTTPAGKRHAHTITVSIPVSECEKAANIQRRKQEAIQAGI